MEREEYRRAVIDPKFLGIQALERRYMKSSLLVQERRDFEPGSLSFRNLTVLL